jgi:hypothetical protein
LMLHCVPAQGLVNHGFYNYNPRFFLDLALANKYQIYGVYFTADFKPELFEYTLELFKQYDSRDVMLYVVLKKEGNAPFKQPFDGIFAEDSKLDYHHDGVLNGPSISANEFAAYIKTTWENIRVSGVDSTSSAVDADHGHTPKKSISLIQRLFGPKGR